MLFYSFFPFPLFIYTHYELRCLQIRRLEDELALQARERSALLAQFETERLAWQEELNALKQQQRPSSPTLPVASAVSNASETVAVTNHDQAETDALAAMRAHYEDRLRAQQTQHELAAAALSFSTAAAQTSISPHSAPAIETIMAELVLLNATLGARDEKLDRLQQTMASQQQLLSHVCGLLAIPNSAQRAADDADHGPVPSHQLGSVAMEASDAAEVSSSNAPDTNIDSEPSLLMELDVPPVDAFGSASEPEYHNAIDVLAAAAE